MYRHIRHKYGAKRCEVDGIKFPSKLERNVYLALKEYKDSGFIRNLMRQIPFYLDSSRHVVDFMIFLEDQVLFIEAKGRDLGIGSMKRKQVEARESLDIHVVKSVKDTHELMKRFGSAQKG